MERLQKVMAHAGIASRRKCEEIILEGRVKVNGQVVRELGAKVRPQDTVEVDGIQIYKEEPRYYLFYKPAGVLSSVADDRGRPVVLDYFPEVEERIYPVGRLDYNTTGILLLSNDGDFSNLMMHPKFQMPKLYLAKLNGIPTDAEIRQLESGVLVDGKKTSRARARIKSQNFENQTALVELTLYEGWNHQVKKMFEAIGYRVNRLKRERLAFLDLGDLRPGQWRELTAFEVDKLKKQARANIEG